MAKIKMTLEERLAQKPKITTVSVSYRINKELVEKIKYLSKKHSLTETEIITEILQENLENITIEE